MEQSAESLAFNRGVAPLLRVLLRDRASNVIEFQPDPMLQARIDELATRNNEGELSEFERGMYRGYVRANKFVSILKRHAERLQMTTS